MTIAETTNTSKGVDTGQNGKRTSLIRCLPKDAFFIIILTLTSTGSFGLGVVAGREGGGVPSEVFIEKPQGQEAAPAAARVESKEIVPAPASGGQYVGSKTGTKYYLPWCGTVKRIKDENKVWFATKEEAEAAGYEPGKNCKGL